jgi:hypothetical protein
VSILACKYFLFVYACQQSHKTTQYITSTITLTNDAHKQHHGVNPYHCYTCLSAEPCLAAKQFICFLPLKKNIADMADLLLTIEMYKLWHKGMAGG